MNMTGQQTKYSLWNSSQFKGREYSMEVIYSSSNQDYDFGDNKDSRGGQERHEARERVRL